MRRDSLTLYVLIAAVVALPVGLDSLRARAATQWESAQAYEDVYYLPPPEWLPVFSLSWDEALADLVWMRALIYYGDEIVNHGDVEFVFAYGTAIETLDPHFVDVYPWVGTAGLYRPEAITVEDVNRVIDFMERGAQRHPESCELSWQLGAVIAFELPPMLDDLELSNQARQRALPYLMRANRLGCAPPYAAMSNAAIAGRAGRLDLALQALREQLERETNPQRRQQLEARFRQLATQRDTEAFIAESNRLDARRRATFPYVSPAFFEVLGEDRPPVDLDTPIREGLAEAYAAEE